MPTSSPLTLAYGGVGPSLESPPACGEDAAILGRVTMGRGAILGLRAVIRADGHFVRIGRDVRLGERSTVHIAHEVYPTIIGDRVAVGADAVVHACTVGNDCLIEDGAVVLDGSTLEDGVVLAAGSIVFPRSRLQGGWLYEGRPAKAVRPLSAGEVEERRSRRPPPDGGGDAVLDPDRSGLRTAAFVAGTARLRGSVRGEADCSIWFSCDLDAGDAEIAIGRNANIQDNTVVRCSGAGLILGRDSTIGHNVHLEDCVIGERSLVGIGSIIVAGTVIESGAFVAAGARTTPGQVLETGWLWGGSPARPLARLDENKRVLISATVTSYCQYAHDFARSQRDTVSTNGQESC